MRYLLFSVSIIFCCSCASDYRYMKAIETNTACSSKLAPKLFTTSWYHASVDVVGRHISGLLLIKNMPDSSYRVVFTNEAGVTFFDFGFAGKETFKVYNIISQLNKKPVVQTLRKDFELILGLPFRKGPYQAYALNDEIFFGVRQKKETAYFITNKENYFSSEVFGKILSYVQKHPRQFKMKDTAGKAMLVIQGIKTVDAAIELLNQLADRPIKSANEILSK